MRAFVARVGRPPRRTKCANRARSDRVMAATAVPPTTTERTMNFVWRGQAGEQPRVLGRCRRFGAGRRHSSLHSGAVGIACVARSWGVGASVGRDDWHDDVVRARENGATLFGLPQLHVDLGLVKFSAMFCHQQNDSKVRVVLFAAVRRRRNAHDSSSRLSPRHARTTATSPSATSRRSTSGATSSASTSS